MNNPTPSQRVKKSRIRKPQRKRKPTPRNKMVLPAVVTPALLAAIRSTPRLPANTWYMLAATALSTLNRPDEIPKIFNHAIQHGGGAKDVQPSADEQLTIARRTREALVKSSAIVGLPKTINALFALKGVTPKKLFDEASGPNPSRRIEDLYKTPASQILQRGQKFFDQVYGKVTGRVMGQMDNSGTEDLGLMARLEYGYVLSPVNILGAAETSYGESCLLSAGIVGMGSVGEQVWANLWE
jgi:hypothetical protein